jgi:flagellar export protein FliJ
VRALESLIRLHRWRLDERRRQLAELEGFAERLRQDRRRLEAELADEQAAAGRSFEGQLAYPGYLRRVRERRTILDRSLAETEAQIAAAREALGEAFQELKRHEIAQASRDFHQRQQLVRRERIELDALAIENHRRRTGTSGD